MSADNPLTIRVSDDARKKLEDMIEKSGISKKDFIDNMIQQYDLYNTSKSNSLITTDIEELTVITKRINSIYINIGERISTIQNETEQNYKIKYEQLQQTIDQLTEKVQELTTLTNEQSIQIKQLKSQTLEDTKTINDLKDDKERASALIKEYEKRLKEFEANTNPDLKTKVGTLESQIEQLKLQKDIEITELKENYIKKLEENQKQYNTILAENQKQYNSIIEKFQTQKAEAEEAPSSTAKTTTKKRRSTKSKEAEQTTTEQKSAPAQTVSEPDSTKS